MAWDDIKALDLTLGAEGLFLRRNQNLVPVGSLRTARNLTLEDDTVRTGGGASILGSAAGATLTGLAAIDYFPSLSTQRTVVVFDDGTIRKDNGSGASWVTLKSGLTTAGQVPMFALAGLELVNRNRKLFFCDRVNTVQVLAADGATTADLATPPADWTGSSQPGFLFPHERWLWGGGNANDPKRLYRSHSDNHEDFTTLPFSLHLAGEYERLVAGLSYKGGALVFGYPEGVWFVHADSPDAPATGWEIVKVARPGASGPANIVAIEDDVLWLAPDGSLHLVSATNATGSATASDIGYRKLPGFVGDTLNLSRAAYFQWIYYASKQKAWLACSTSGATTKAYRMEFDVRRRADLGERWLTWDRDRNEALFLRKNGEILIPAMVDNVGQVWELDRPDRNSNSSGYTAEWATNDLDGAALLYGRPGWKTNGHYIQVEYDPRQAVTLTVEIIRDGTARQTLTFSLAAAAVGLPQALPFVLGGTRVLRVTRPQRLLGQAYRWGVRGYTTGANADASVARVSLGLSLAA